MRKIENMTFDEERALYGSNGVHAHKCSFDGPQDGESAFKESSDILATECYFNLRYPFWHDHRLEIKDCEMTELCRAALWYSEIITIENTNMHGIKALRECADIKITNCDIVSPEFGWSSKNIELKDTSAVSEYFMMRSENLDFNNLNFKGKYSFQYIKNATFENCKLDTKDAFWHAENVTVKNCYVKGEYLAWYAKNITFENCTIIGTQPFCYCEDLKLINCEMIEADLAFEKSDVEATVTTPMISIKNPKSGNIYVPEVFEIILDDENAKGNIIITK